ncbi:MAG: hypothetical protein KF683_19255 [Rubrivivax sp.]|nr:hypothetical protein [Rubrivivax sp.]
MSAAQVLHETSTRLRLRTAAQRPALAALEARLRALPGVRSVRSNGRLRCVVVSHDGRLATRAAVMEAMAAPVAPVAPVAHPAVAAGRRRPARRAASAAGVWGTGIAALALPLLPSGWRPGGALGVVAARVLTQPGRLRSDPAAVLLDAASQSALALTGQSLAVSASVLLRLLAEALSEHLLRQTDELLEHLLPTPADQVRVLQDGDGREHWWPLRRVRAGDRLRLYPGDVVPVDGCVSGGDATLQALAGGASPRTVRVGDHLAAGEKLQQGTVELRAEADAAGSQLQRLRAQLAHAIGARDPAGPLAGDLQRLVALPLSAAAVVYGLTGDGGRAAAMLQSDPQQGLDLALPLAREVALVALARHGLLSSGLETIERLALARTLVLQDSAVLASGRWTVEQVVTESGGDPAAVRGWIAALADLPVAALEVGGLPDTLVRSWVRHGAVLRLGAHEVHLAGAARLRRVWGVAIGEQFAAPRPQRAPAALRREFALVAGARVVARVLLASPWREGVAVRLAALRELGFERIAVFAEDDGGERDLRGAGTGAAACWLDQPDVACLAADAPLRGEWLADAVHDGTPVVMLHTVLRDLVPAGSLSLTPTDADAGAHGVLLGDPLAALGSARRLALAVHRRLRLQQGAAVGVNAALMTVSALRWLPPVATTTLHHGFALLVLLDSLRIEALRNGGAAAMAPAAPLSTQRRRTADRAARSVTA